MFLGILIGIFGEIPKVKKYLKESLEEFLKPGLPSEGILGEVSEGKLVGITVAILQKDILQEHSQFL